MKETEVPCEICCDPVSLDEAHWLHHTQCPNYGREELTHTCECAIFCHPECCPTCPGC